MIMAELLDEENVGENSPEALDLESTVSNLSKQMDNLEVSSFLDGPNDSCNAFLSVHDCGVFCELLPDKRQDHVVCEYTYHRYIDI